jgi:HEAT repeat protein
LVNNFKSDESFLKKLAIGAAGTNVTIHLLQQMGFNPIELERGSTGFKIWKRIKIKRIRVPDILCLRTGQRFESRGKTKLEISMSHSLNDPKRAWDFGMRSDDYVSIVLFQQVDDSPVDWKQISPVHFIKVNDLRNAFAENLVSITTPKGVEEGSEIRVVWPTAAANHHSVISFIDDSSIKLSPIGEERQQTIKIKRIRGNRTIILHPQYQIGAEVNQNQIVASVVPVAISLVCPPEVGEEYFREKLRSTSLSERYAAAKALRFRGYTGSTDALVDRINDPDEDIYVKLEAAAALAIYNDERGWEFIENNLSSPTITVPLETQLETVIVSSEIKKDRSQNILIQVLEDNSRDDEIRAGAAWALGQFSSTASATALVNTFNLHKLEIKIEAARALLKMAPRHIEFLVNLLKQIDNSKRDGISWALARTGGYDPSTMLSDDADNNLRQWASYIIGYGKERFDPIHVQAICESDPEVYFAASVLWQILESWISDLKEY